MVTVPPGPRAERAERAHGVTSVEAAGFAGIDLAEMDVPDEVDGAAVVAWLETGEGDPWLERS